MIEYLTECFGNSITSSCFDFPQGTPIYLKYSYTLEKYTWQNDSFVMITPLDDTARLPVLKKHFYQIEEKVSFPCALNLEWLTPMQRSNLMEDKIPFVSGKNQVYLPFWGCVFREKYNSKRNTPEVMSPATQLVFLWTYYRLRNNLKVNLTAAVSEIGLSKTAVSRAFLELVNYNLVRQRQEGVTKWIVMSDEISESLNNAMVYMGSPVWKKIYLKKIPESIEYKIGGPRALEAISTTERDGSIVIDKATAVSVSGDCIISKREFDDFGGIVAEVWKYDPRLLSSDNLADDISLILSLNQNSDERIQKELDTIKEKHGIRR